MSPVTGGVDAQGRIVLSTYPARAKTRNAEKDPRVSVLVLSDDWNGPWVQVDGDALRARTRSVAAFATALPRLARDQGATLREVRTTDESLEQVFRYLVGRR